MFWSDLGSAVGYEAIGLVDSSLPTVAVFAKMNPDDYLRDLDRLKIDLDDEETKKPETATTPEAATSVIPSVKADVKESLPPSASDPPHNYGKGVIFYMQGDQIVGILLWNVFNRISIARKILMSEETFTDLNEVAKLFDIFDQHQPEKPAE